MTKVIILDLNFPLQIDWAIVAIPRVAAQAPNPEYNVEHFQYNKEQDDYTCPQNQKLISNGKWHKAKTSQFKRYTTKACVNCSVKKQCSKARYGKAIQRSEYQELIEKNKQRVKQNESYYKRRQAIVEHPYGTIKRQWGFDHIMTKKTIERASADVGFIMVAYNLRRLINIIGIKELIEYAILQLSHLSAFFELSESKPRRIRTWFSRSNKTNINFYVSLKPLYLNFKSAA